MNSDKSLFDSCSQILEKLNPESRRWFKVTHKLGSEMVFVIKRYIVGTLLKIHRATKTQSGTLN